MKQQYGAVSAAVHQRDDAQQAKDHERRLWQSEARWKYMPFVSGKRCCVASARIQCTVSHCIVSNNAQLMMPQAWMHFRNTCAPLTFLQSVLG
jgi:hypothetical protein